MDLRVSKDDRVARWAERLVGARRKLATAVLVLMAAWLVFEVMTSPNGIIVYQKKRAEYRRLQEEVEQVTLENQRIQEQNRKLQANDPATIEKEAREQLRYARPGEMVYVMPDDSRTKTNTAKKE